MVGVGDQRDGDIVLGDGVLQSRGVVDVEADALGVGEVAGELLGRGQGAGGDSDVHASVGEQFDGGRGNEAGAEEEGGLRHCCCRERCTWRMFGGEACEGREIQLEAKLDGKVFGPRVVGAHQTRGHPDIGLTRTRSQSYRRRMGDPKTKHKQNNASESVRYLGS